jgi:hypothetical protein
MASNSDFYYYTQIPDTSINSGIIELIESYEYNEEQSEYIKGKMTSWNIKETEEIRILKSYILDYAKCVTKHKFKREHEFRIDSMWGIKYESGDSTGKHDHWPSIWTACYYLNPPNDCAGLYFTDLKEELKVENGMLVLFPGWVSHEVRSHKFVGNRYVIAANLFLSE